jgi:hypothetical protein
MTASEKATPTFAGLLSARSGHSPDNGSSRESGCLILQNRYKRLQHVDADGQQPAFTECLQIGLER